MASLLEDPSGNWHVHFRYGGKRFKRSLQTSNRKEAENLLGRIEDNLQLVRRGKGTIPSSADVFLFLLSDGKVEAPPELPPDLTLRELLDEYHAAMAAPLEPSTVYTIGVHT